MFAERVAAVLPLAAAGCGGPFAEPVIDVPAGGAITPLRKMSIMLID